MGTSWLAFTSPERGSHIQLTADNEMIDQAERLSKSFGAFFDAARRLKTLEVDVGNDQSVIEFNFKRAWLRRTPGERHFAMHAAQEVLTDLVNSRKPEESGKEPFVRIGRKSAAEGRLPMLAQIPWPQAEPSAVADLTTIYMQQVAIELRYPSHSDSRRAARQVPDLVFAWLDRQSGVELQTNEIGSCSIGTDGSIYQAEDPVLKLTAHNLYSRDQQIICLAGAVAIASADELLQQASSSVTITE